jgi:REP element-mobilizing transposase RayT
VSAYVRWLVAQKREWHHPPAPSQEAAGFRGWHTRGYLPHFDAPGLVQMVNFHLADSFPQEHRHEWEAIQRLEDKRERHTRLEAFLDQGHGACELAVPAVAQRLENILFFDDGRRCQLLAWVIMPNHAHVLVEIQTTPLNKLVQSWKKLSTNFVNAHSHRTGEWWQADYFDRFMRDEVHFRKALHYIESNPVKAGLVKDAKEWPWGSARRRPDGMGLQPVAK